MKIQPTYVLSNQENKYYNYQSGLWTDIEDQEYCNIYR